MADVQIGLEHWVGGGYVPQLGLLEVTTVLKEEGTNEDHHLGILPGVMEQCVINIRIFTGSYKYQSDDVIHIQKTVLRTIYYGPQSEF